MFEKYVEKICLFDELNQNSFPDAKTEPISSQVAPLTSFEVAFCEELVLFFLLLNCLVIFVQHDYPRVLCYIR